MATQRDAPASLTIPLWILAVLATAMFLRYTRELCIPIAIAALLAWALAPAVRALQRMRLPRWAAVVVLLSTLAGLTLWGGYALSDNVVRGIRELPEAVQRMRERVEGGGGPMVERLKAAMEELRKMGAAPTQTPGGAPQQAQDQGQSAPAGSGSAGQVVVRGSTSVIAFLGHLVVIVFLVFFLLLTASSYRARIIDLAGPRLSARREASQVLDEITEQIERFLLVRLVTAAVVGVVTWLAMLAMGAPNPALWGVLAGIFNSIPYFGPLIVSGGLFVVGITSEGLTLGLKMAAVAMVITTLEGWLITPPLMGKAARMHTLAVFVSLLVWSWAWGIWGTILAVPMMVVIKSIADHVDALRPVSVLLEE